MSFKMIGLSFNIIRYTNFFKIQIYLYIIKLKNAIWIIVLPSVIKNVYPRPIPINPLCSNHYILYSKNMIIINIYFNILLFLCIIFVFYLKILLPWRHFYHFTLYTTFNQNRTKNKENSHVNIKEVLGYE